MKSLLMAFTMALAGLAVTLAPVEADAKRLGGGRPAGMQRQAPPAQPATPSPTQAAKPATAPGATPAPTGNRWLGPIAGLAAGLGLAALASHFGFGEGLANMMTILLLAGVAFFVIRWLMRRAAPQRSGSRLQYAGAGGRADPQGWDADATQRASQPQQTPSYGGGHAPACASSANAAPAIAAPVVPDGFDAVEFERLAKMIFIRLQAANDAGAIDDLRKFTTPELFASLRLDLQDRGAAAQQTDVVQLNAQIVDTAREDGQWIVSVRFSGLIREDIGGTAEPFNEVWHLVRPVDGSREWQIAGITPQQ